MVVTGRWLVSRWMPWSPGVRWKALEPTYEQDKW